MAGPAGCAQVLGADRFDCARAAPWLGAGTRNRGRCGRNVVAARAPPLRTRPAQARDAPRLPSLAEAACGRHALRLARAQRPHARGRARHGRRGGRARRGHDPPRGHVRARRSGARSAQRAAFACALRESLPLGRAARAAAAPAEAGGGNGDHRAEQLFGGRERGARSRAHGRRRAVQRARVLAGGQHVREQRGQRGQHRQRARQGAVAVAVAAAAGASGAAAALRLVVREQHRFHPPRCRRAQLARCSARRTARLVRRGGRAAAERRGRGVARVRRVGG
mmetsp:Transcript_46044/g.107523  ORF Transcript_46044/g.107523 Transcript_46044/m.107523 type:complete len:280 (+) Transcript_46044:787-1626(+)